MIRNCALAAVLLLSHVPARADIVDDMGPASFRMVYRDSVERTFLTGSGISQNSISCMDGMELGLLKTNYHFYFYKGVADATDNNSGNRCVPQNYLGEAGLCGLHIRRVGCDGAPRAAIAVSNVANDTFNVGVGLASAPEPTGQIALVGYVATLPESGECPEGLVKVSFYQASPDTYAGGPSNLWNPNGTLNDYRIERTDADLAPMLVQHFPGTGACANGVCQPPSSEYQTVGAYEYVRIGQPFCAVPVERFERRRI